MLCFLVQDFDRHFGSGGLKAGDVIGFVWVAEGLLTEINGEVCICTHEYHLSDTCI